jgi:exonuclease-1
MGISGLLPLVQPASVEVHIQSYAGMRVAVDAYSWLHKGAYACAMDLAQARKTQGCAAATRPQCHARTLTRTLSDRYVKYCMRRVAMMKHYNVTPVMVFDGAYLPSKAEKETERRE